MLSLLLPLSFLLRPALALRPEDAAVILQIEAQRLPPMALADFTNSPDAATRARAALALGRLRQEAALEPLRVLAADADPKVRAEATFALGQTPGSSAAILPLLSGDPERAVRAAAAEALGKQGGAEVLPALVGALSDSPPLFERPTVAEAAAAALGRLAMREVPVSANLPALAALLDQLERLDTDTRRAAAFALARIAAKSLPDADVARLLHAAAEDRDPVVRAFLLRASGPLPLSPERRDALYGQTARDTDAGVRIATARAAGLTGWAGVTALLSDADIGVRLEAISATGKLKEVDVAALLMPLVLAGNTLAAAEAARTTGDPSEVIAAAALEALGDRLPAAGPGSAAEALDPARPTRIRVAAAAVISTKAELIRLAVHDGEAPVRTTAASRLLELEPAAADMLALFDAFDTEVQSVAATWVSERPTAAAEPRLIAALRTANPTDLDLLESALTALGKLYEGTKPLVRTPSPEATAQVRPLLAHPEPRIFAAAKATGRLLGLAAPPYAHRGVQVDLAAVAAMRSARIQTSRGEVVVSLDPDHAPLTVWNFASLADKAYFDGLQIHRVVPDFVVQDGDPRGDGWGGPGYTIPDELGPGHYREGTLGMALSGPDTGGSQWFITLSPQPHLDGTYTIFGQVTSGMQVLRRIQPGDRILHIQVERASVWLD